MIDYLSRLINNISNTQQSLPAIFAKVIERDSETFVDLNVDQLRRGIAKTGDLIEPEYQSDLYAEFKQSIGSQAPLGVPDLILEGDFTEGFFIERRGDQILSDSKDEKTPELDAKYENIFGLTSESKDELIENNVQELQNEIENEIFR